MTHDFNERPLDVCNKVHCLNIHKLPMASQLLKKKSWHILGNPTFMNGCMGDWHPLKYFNIIIVGQKILNASSFPDSLLEIIIAVHTIRLNNTIHQGKNIDKK